MINRSFQVKVAQKFQKRLASKIDKEEFLSQLKEQWKPYIKRNSDIEIGVSRVRASIVGSGFEEAFDKVGITDGDLRTILREVQEEKPEQVINEEKTGRNESCPCGSGKKYKRCCGSISM